MCGWRKPHPAWGWPVKRPIAWMDYNGRKERQAGFAACCLLPALLRSLTFLWCPSTLLPCLGGSWQWTATSSNCELKSIFPPLGWWLGYFVTVMRKVTKMCLHLGLLPAPWWFVSRDTSEYVDAIYSVTSQESLPIAQGPKKDTQEDLLPLACLILSPCENSSLPIWCLAKDL